MQQNEAACYFNRWQNVIVSSTHEKYQHDQVHQPRKNL
jgi:hypothetical protein